MCDKVTNRVSLTRRRGQTGETGGTNLGRIVENEDGEEEDTEDDEGVGDEREIWSVTHVTEEDFETTEGETEDLYNKLMEMVGWNLIGLQCIYRSTSKRFTTSSVESMCRNSMYDTQPSV